jgi:Phage terminase large subunit
LTQVAPSSKSISASIATSSDQRPYQPHGGALRLFYCKDDEVLLDGPAGTGKSRAALEKIYLIASKYPGCRILMARKTRASMTESTLVTWESKVLPAGSPIAEGAQRRMRQAYSFPNGSEVVVGGMDNALKIMSTEYDIIYVPEATELEENDWESLTTRLRNKVVPYQQLIADCNPGAPTHWLNQRCNNGLTTRLLSRHEDNPTVDQVYLEKLRRLTGARRKRLYQGIWAAQEGLVYDFDPAVHLASRFDIPATWKRRRVIDFGFTNPFVCQWWAEDPDGRQYRYREIYMTGRLTEDHQRQILYHSRGETYTQTIADHDAEDRSTLTRPRIYYCKDCDEAILSQADEAAHAGHQVIGGAIATTAAHKPISPGIQAVQARLKIANDGRTRLLFLRDSLIERDTALMEAKKPCSTEEEFDGYLWPKTSGDKTKKEVPVKEDDHGLDSCRYLVAAVDLRGRQATSSDNPIY